MLSALPPEIIYNIFVNLDCKTFGFLSCTNRFFHQIGSDNQLWKQLCLRDYLVGHTESSLMENKVPISFLNWKSYYIERYNFRDDSLVWKGKPDFVIGSRYSHSANLSPDRKQLLIIGGEKSTNERYSDVIAVDVDHLKVDYTANLSTNLSRHQACLYNNKIYVFGGYDGLLNFNELSSFNLEDKKWESIQTKNKCPQPRSNHSCVIVGDSLYMFGGNNRDSKGLYQILGDFYRLDLKSMIWHDMSHQVKGSLPTPRSGHRFTAFENRIFMFGGGCWNGIEERWTDKYNDIQIFDIIKNEWYTPKIKGDINVCTFSSCVRLGFQLAVFGGQALHSAWTKSTLFTLDTVTFEWKKWNKKDKDCIPLTKDMASLTVVNDNTAYLIGGNHGGPTGDVNVLHFKWNANADIYVDKKNKVSKGEP